MAASNTFTDLPNPYTPMAFVPPEYEKNNMFETYATVASLAVLLWDILVHVAQDYRLAIQFGINFSFMLYSLARVTCFAYVLGVVIIATAPVSNCEVAHQIGILSFSTPLSVLPFLMRVSALYRRDRYVVAFFSTIWLFVLGCYIVAATQTVGKRMGASEYCAITRTRLANQLTTSSIFVYDGLVFIATSWAFMRYSYSDSVNVKNGIKVLVLGKYLPAFSRSILRDGQAYFLATIILNTIFCASAFIHDSPISACTISFPFYVMLNNVSSHVYRNLRLGFYRDETITSSIINKALKGVGQSSHHGILNPRDPDAGDETKLRTSLGQGTQGEIKQRMGV